MANGDDVNPKKRPAEASSVAGYAALLIARALGVTDPNTILALAGIIAFLPAAVTWIVTLIRNGKTKNGGSSSSPSGSGGS